MKTAKNISDRASSLPGRHASQGGLAAVWVVLLGISLNLAPCQAQQPGPDVPGAQVLTRGPVHEAFAGMVTFNPQPGIIVTKPPPALIEEVPPEERPAGDNITWIPGYWAWDDERSDFLWVSGAWRALPPGRAWMAGYWGQTTQGYQWTSGYWADAAATEATYLPPPPATVEAGPNIAAPSLDYGWTPGCWVWYQERYAWRPGYWAPGRADWAWMPAHYVWTPRGYLFVGGFWDYSIERRGMLFAPVYFQAGMYSRRGYSYSPTIVIDLGVFTDHLFLRPSYQHYYFGDYYAPSYVQGGFYASFSFSSGRYGYDPIYSHQRWEHREDREWEHRAQASYQYRRDHELARPPRTWATQRTINPSTAESQANRVMMAAPISQLAQRQEIPMRFQPVALAERQQLALRGQEVQKSRDQRRTLEAIPAATAARRPGGVMAPAKVELSRSPIVAKPTNQLSRNQAPPQPQRAPKTDLKLQPQPVISSRPPTVARSNSPSEPRQLEPAKQLAPGRSQPAPRVLEQPANQKPAASEKGATRLLNTDPKKTGDPLGGNQTPPRAQRALTPPLRIQSQPATAVRPPTVAQSNPPLAPRQLEKAKQPTPVLSQPAPRAPTPVPKIQSQPAMAVRPPTVVRSNPPSAPRQLEPAKQPAPGRSQPAPRVSEQPAKTKPEASEKGATRLLNTAAKKKGE